MGVESTASAKKSARASSPGNPEPKDNKDASKSKQKESKGGLMSGTTGLILCALGIYFAFGFYGSLQEDVFTFKDPNGEKFTQAWMLQTLEALANVVVGFGGMMIAGRTPGLPLGMFAISGATQVSAKACTSLALASGLSFPVATLAKSAKMAPVMLGSIVLGGKKYSVRQYLQVFSIIASTVIVSMNKKAKPGDSSSSLGLVFICSSLALDGVTGGVQDKLKAGLKTKGLKAKPYDMMFWTNFFMMLVGLVVSVVYGEAQSGIAFIMANPTIMKQVLMFAACSALGQSFIFTMVSEFGPLKNATVTTTRKIFSVLYSIIAKGHVLSPMGWGGIVLGSCGVIGELIPEKSEKKVEEKKDKKAS